MKGLGAAILVGLALGAVSRLIDTADSAPDWIGYVVTPWLAAAWLAGAWTPALRQGALNALALLLATVVAYVLVADASSLPVVALYGLAVVAGPVFGAAGATWRGRGRWAAVGGALLGAAVILESLALQLAVHSTPEHLVLAGESLAGIGLTLWLGRMASPPGRGV